MPLISMHKLADDTYGALWKLNEDASYFLEHMGFFFPLEQEGRAITHKRRKTEWLAARWTLKQLFDWLKIPYHGIEKKNNIKPSLIGHPSYHVSISHCFPWIWVIINTSNKNVGADIQKVTPKINALKKRFLNSKESLACRDNIDAISLYWSAKESIYKAHHESLSFRKHISIEYLNPSLLLGGNLQVLVYSIRYTVYYQYIQSCTKELFVKTWFIQNKKII